MRATHLLPALFLIAVALGCGSAPADPTRAGSTTAGSTTADPATYESSERGFTVWIPPGWHRAERPLTVLTDPVEVLVAATYRPRTDGPGTENCGPLAFEGFDADEVLVTILERGLAPASAWPDFPPRPDHFAFEPGMTSEFTECLSTTRNIPLKDHWFRFTDAGRHFHVLVAIGRDAAPEAGLDAYRMLDSLSFDPSVKPDWRTGE